MKLALKEGEEPPQWVTDLIESGMLTEVHKFSKFIHGCATLLPQQVMAYPYWIDDQSIRASIIRSQVSGKTVRAKRQSLNLGNGRAKEAIATVRPSKSSPLPLGVLGN